jgi:hypothetical protein
MGKALYIQSVEDAASIAGGHERLAAVLGVSTHEVERWCSGASIPECGVFLRVIDLIFNPALANDPAPRRLEPGTRELAVPSLVTPHNS